MILKNAKPNEIKFDEAETLCNQIKWFSLNIQSAWALLKDRFVTLDYIQILN